MDDMSLVFGGIQTVAIVGGIILALVELRQMREQRRIELDTRQAQLFMQIYNPFTTKEFQRGHFMARRMQWDSYDDYRRKYVDPDSGRNHEAYLSAAADTNYFEGLGVLVNRGLLDIGFIEELMGSHITTLWEQFESLMMETRRRGSPRFESFEYLYRELKKYQAKLDLQKT